MICGTILPIFETTVASTKPLDESELEDQVS